jgi:hypothetical protein
LKPLELSELVFGLVLAGKIPPDFLNASLLSPPYDRGAKLIKNHGRDETELMDRLGFEAINAAKTAAASAPVDIDWLKLLEITAGREQLAQIFEKETKRLRNGEDCDEMRILAAMNTRKAMSNRYKTWDTIDPEEGVWRPSYYAPFDENFGGIPEAGVTVVGASPASGKTSLLVQLAAGGARHQKHSLIYTLEMLSTQLLYRALQVAPLTKTERSYIISCDEMIGIDEIAVDAARIAAEKDLHIIGIDFADLVIVGDEDEQKMAHVYFMCQWLAKTTKVPVVLLAQLNRNYVGGIPRVHHLRYSGLAEALCSMILLLYNPSGTFSDTGKDVRLPPMEGRAYILQGKSRFGFKNGCVGALDIEWDGYAGWGTRVWNWIPLS